MNKCRKYRSMFIEAHYDELDIEQKRITMNWILNKQNGSRIIYSHARNVQGNMKIFVQQWAL